MRVDGKRHEVRLDDGDARRIGVVTNTQISDMWRESLQSMNQVLVLCGDSGIGKTHFLNCVAGIERDLGVRVRRISLRGCEERELGMRFSRFSRETAIAAKGVPRLTVCVDDVPVADPAIYRRMARGVEKMVSEGCFVVIALRPECEVLAELLDNPRLIGASRLVMPPRREHGALTNGMPGLAIALSGSAESVDARPASVGAYGGALREACLDALRDSLTEEEVELRLSMVLLGRGSFGDLGEVSRHADDCDLELVERDVPLFGVSSASRSFSVAGVCDIDGLRGCRQVLRTACGGRERLVLDAAKVLMRRDEPRRAGVVLDLVRGALRSDRLVARWGTELVGAGCVSLVEQSVRLADMSDPTERDMALANALAVAEVSGKRGVVQDLRRRVLGPVAAALGVLRGDARGDADAGAAHGEGEDGRSTALRRVACLGLARDALAGASVSRATIPASRMDGRMEVMLRHAEVMGRMARGDLLGAFNQLLDDPDRGRVDGLGPAFLAEDFHVVETLLGEVPENGGASGWELARDLYAESGTTRLALLHEATESALKILVGRATSFAGIERTLTRVHDTGDVVPEAFFLIAAAVADVRVRAYARASVRAERAGRLAEKISAPYLVAASELVRCAVDAALGEEVALGPEADGPVAGASGGAGAVPGPVDGAYAGPAGALYDLRRMMVQASRGDLRDGVRLDVLDRSYCSREVLWALNLLMNDCGSASRAFREIAPVVWLRSAANILEGMSLADGARAEGPELAAPRTESPCGEGASGMRGGGASEASVRIRVLGTFSVSVGGRTLPPRALGPRRARELVYTLALRKGHSISKYDALAIVWGDYDYAAASQKLYESICMARKALAMEGEGESVIVTGRRSGRIALDTSRVSVDLDEFERNAHAALVTEGADRKVVDLVSVSRGLYAGGPVRVFDDPSGSNDGRLGEVVRLHTDAMAAGAQAALREGKTYLASQLSREALSDDPLREDAMLGHVASLGILGRTSEIVSAYREYKDVLVRSMHASPSTAVRRGVDDALGRSGSDLSTEEIDRLDALGRHR